MPGRQESMSSPNSYDLDLSGFIKYYHIRLSADYVFDLPADLPLSLLTRLQRLYNRIYTSMTAEGGDDADLERVQAAEAGIWVVLEQVMVKAEPGPPKPLAEMFTMGAALSLLNFLVQTYLPSMPTATMGSSSTSSPSPAGSEAV